MGVYVCGGIVGFGLVPILCYTCISMKLARCLGCSLSLSLSLTSESKRHWSLSQARWPTEHHFPSLSFLVFISPPFLFFHRGVGGGPWPRRVMSCPVAESTAVRWIWKQKQVLELLCATRISKTPSQSLVSQHRASPHHLRCYWGTVIFTLKGKHTQKWNLFFFFPPIEHLKRTWAQ